MFQPEEASAITPYNSNKSVAFTIKYDNQTINNKTCTQFVKYSKSLTYMDAPTVPIKYLQRSCGPLERDKIMTISQSKKISMSIEGPTIFQ